jgi:hypothetical protein
MDACPASLSISKCPFPHQPAASRLSSKINLHIHTSFICQIFKKATTIEPTNDPSPPLHPLASKSLLVITIWLIPAFIPFN